MTRETLIDAFTDHGVHGTTEGWRSPADVATQIMLLVKSSDGEQERPHRDDKPGAWALGKGWK